MITFARGPAASTAIRARRPASHMSEVSTYATGPNQYQPIPAAATSRPYAFVVSA